MCGSLRLEGESRINPGGRIPSTHFESVSGKCESYIWDGFARTDGSRTGHKTMAEQWDSKEWKATVLKITGFTEKGAFCNGKRIGVIVNDETGTMKVLTRPARTEREQQLHHRWPSRLPENLKLVDYVARLNEVAKGDYKVPKTAKAA